LIQLTIRSGIVIVVVVVVVVVAAAAAVVVHIIGKLKKTKEYYVCVSDQGVTRVESRA
jgi:type IV secretory pathway component VirB8